MQQIERREAMLLYVAMEFVFIHLASCTKPGYSGLPLLAAAGAQGSLDREGRLGAVNA